MYTIAMRWAGEQKWLEVAFVQGRSTAEAIRYLLQQDAYDGGWDEASSHRQFDVFVGRVPKGIRRGTG